VYSSFDCEIHVRIAAVAFLAVGWQTPARAADLKQETAQAWDD
jgi:hypothetical protein